MAEPGILTENLKPLLTQNLGELTTVEGNILSAAAEKEIKSIFITSCHPLEGKTICAISIAYALSTEANSKTLLVDGNFHSPKIHDIFNVDVTPGLSDLLIGNAEYHELIRKTEYDNLTIIPHGTEVTNIFDFFRAKIFTDTLISLRENNHYVIFDGLSVFGSSDASVIAKYFDGIILVIEAEKTRWEVVQAAKEKLTRVGGNILGVVLNKRKYYIPAVLYDKS